MINEGQSTEIDKSLGECYYVRGMMYFYLCRAYGRPHNQHEEVKASDYRVTYYIPQNAINAYPGTLTQNPTDNSGVILK